MSPPAPSASRPLGPRLQRALRRRLVLHRRAILALLIGVGVWATLRSLSPAPAATVEIVVAAHPLLAGQRLADRDLATESVPRDSALATHCADVCGERGPLLGRVLAGPLEPGEQVTVTRLVTPRRTPPPGRVTLPIRLPDAEMAGLLRPGDTIDLLATDPTSGETRWVARDVSVVGVPAVSRGTDGLTERASDGALVTVDVDVSEVATVTGASLAHFLTVAF